ncbi:MAG: SRPBCC family protein [Litorimonas sp.]
MARFSKPRTTSLTTIAVMSLSLIAASSTLASAQTETQAEILTQASETVLPPAPVLSPYTLSEDQLAVLETDVPVLDVWAGATNNRVVEVFGAIDIDATPEQIWSIMKNCDAQLKIISNMKKCSVTKQGPNAGWDERLQVLSIGRFLHSVKSRFRSDYTPYREIKITRTGGDLSILDGLWNLSLTQNGQTRVTYRARLKPKLPVPRKIMRKGTRKDMPEILTNLRDQAEALHQSEKTAQDVHERATP